MITPTELIECISSMSIEERIKLDLLLARKINSTEEKRNINLIEERLLFQLNLTAEQKEEIKRACLT